MAAALFARKVQLALKKKRAFMSEFEKALGIQAAWRAKRVVFRIKRRKVVTASPTAHTLLRRL